MQSVYEIIILITGIVFRFLLIFNKKTDFDTYGHLYFIREVKHQQAGPFGSIKPQVLGAVNYRLPFLWHWLLGLIPFKYIYQYQRWVNILLDSFFAFLIYFISLYYFERTYLGLLTALLYLYTPMWFSGISTGPRIRSLTPRLASELSVNVFFILLFLPGDDLLILKWVLILLMGVFTLLSSKFGVQALVFLGISVSLFSLSFIPIIGVLGSFTLALVITKGKIIETFRRQFEHLKWYYLKNLKGEMAVSERNSLSRLLDGLKERSFYHKTRALIFRLVRDNSYTSVFFKMPILWCGLFSAIYFLGTGGYSYNYELMSVVYGATLVYFIINIRVFLFLGEAERYLNHVAFFIVAMGVQLLAALDAEWLLSLLIVYGLLFLVFEVFFLERIKTQKSSTDYEKETKSIVKYLNEFIPGDRGKVLCYPYHAVGVWRLLIETPHEALFSLISSEAFFNDFEKKYGAKYPYVKLDKIDEMHSETGVNVVIVEKSKLEEHMGSWKFPPSWKKINLNLTVFDLYIQKELIRE